MDENKNIPLYKMTVFQANILRTVLYFFLICLIAVIDYFTGNELGLSLFYLLPVIAATWQINFPVGIFLSVASALLWTLANSFLGVVYSHSFIPYWNVTVRSIFFITVVVLLMRLKQALAKERQFARKDFLTGIANWQAFTEYASHEVNRARRFRRPMTIIYIDCDNFKTVNDRHGHAAGNKLLKRIAQCIKGTIRSFDIAARLGGDEFILLLPETEKGAAEIVVERVKQSLSEMVANENFPVTFSFGVAVFTIVPQTIDVMVSRADELMYRSKAKGKDCITYDMIGD